MGTRHIQRVITKDGKMKIAQYGQWDGYPSGQGLDILNYLHNGNLKKYEEELEKIPTITDKQAEMVDTDKNWEVNYPYMSRDCGSKIHKMIENGEVKFVAFINEAEANMWCSGFYTIDFQKGLFISEYDGEKVELKINNLPNEEKYLKLFNQN